MFAHFLSFCTTSVILSTPNVARTFLHREVNKVHLISSHDRMPSFDGKLHLALATVLATCLSLLWPKANPPYKEIGSGYLMSKSFSSAICKHTLGQSTPDIQSMAHPRLTHKVSKRRIQTKNTMRAILYADRECIL